mmetsp:Transcript_893/g.2554  ORF Transcript_893/g.2554 Transcript_893/m.2554 type:complete len:203 (+) Transcript_893:1666-2274(+)
MPSVPFNSGFAFRLKIRTFVCGAICTGVLDAPPTWMRRKAKCRFGCAPSKYFGVQGVCPAFRVLDLTTSPSLRTGRTTSFFGFFGLGGSSFLIITGCFPAGFVSLATSSGTPSRASATTTAPSDKLFGSPTSCCMSSSSLPSLVSLMSFGGTFKLYLRFSFRWPGVDWESTGTVTCPLGRETFNCMSGISAQCGLIDRRTLP